MKLFVASSYLNKVEARKVMRRLKAAGHTITFDWTQAERLTTDMHRSAKAQADAQGVWGADALIVVWPGRYGTATEIGIAIAAGISVYVLGEPDVPSIYWYHPLVSTRWTIRTLILELEGE
jgi:nucleoside 2-deoxyribosyltransferase